MLNKNIDGIRKSKSLGPTKIPAAVKPRILKVDGLTRRQVARPGIKSQKTQPLFVATSSPLSYRLPAQAARFAFLKKLYTQRRVPVMAAVMALFLAFAFGGWFALNTTRSAADDQPPAQASQTPAGSLVLSGIATPDPSDAAASNALFNTPIQQLKNYFDSINQPDIINTRQTQLTQFLKDMHSPLVSAAETIAEQPHWQLILAIAFAESTLGKNCNDYNCSNIGVQPGSPYWHKYDSYDAWVLDFNRLLDKKYNDWTLQQMCGVYVKPCNANWLTATQEILDALKDRGIQ